MSLHEVLSDAGCDAMFREHASTSSVAAGRMFRCTVDHYGTYDVQAPSQFEARDKALDLCGVQGDMRRKVSVYVEGVRA